MSIATSYLFLAIVASTCSILVLILSSRLLTRIASINPASLHKMSRLICVLFILSPIVYFVVPVERLTIVSAQSAENEVSVIPSRATNNVELIKSHENQNTFPSSLFLAGLLPLIGIF